VSGLTGAGWLGVVGTVRGGCCVGVSRVIGAGTGNSRKWLECPKISIDFDWLLRRTWQMRKSSYSSWMSGGQVKAKNADDLPEELLAAQTDIPAIRGSANVGRFPIAGLVRRARRLADLSHRQMARRANVSPATVGRVEAGTLAPSVDVFQRLLDSAGLYLAVVDADGPVVEPMGEHPILVDKGGRRYPSHLDILLDPEGGDRWFTIPGIYRPTESFWRNRNERDWNRGRRADRRDFPE
jgi:transcriptional regulator with XRE-family HTH domain